MLSSTQDLQICAMRASDGTIGHVGDLYVDDQSWVIRYLVVDTPNRWRRKHVLIPTQRSTAMSCKECALEIDLSRDEIRAFSAYDSAMVFSRAHETDLYC